LNELKNTIRIILLFTALIQLFHVEAQSDSLMSLSNKPEQCNDRIYRRFKIKRVIKVRIIELGRDSIKYMNCKDSPGTKKAIAKRAVKKVIFPIAEIPQNSLNDKNALFIAVAMTGIVNLTYERHLCAIGKKKRWNLYGRAFYGSAGAIGNDYIQASLLPNLISGRGKNHFEFGLGPVYLFDWDEGRSIFTRPRHFVNIFIQLNMGYRYQSPYKRFIFRTGAGYPEYVYFGMGWSF